jgi:hypothetical protein
MRKFFAFVCIIAIFFTSCGACHENHIGENQISAAALTPEQEDLLRLISFGNQNIYIFDFLADSTFLNVDFWVDIYEYGVVTETPSGLGLMELTEIPMEGQLALIINRDAASREHQFTLISQIGGSVATSQGERFVIETGDFASAFGAMQGVVDIQPDRDIILHMTKFFHGGVSTGGDWQLYAENPELLAIYPRVHAVKARFSQPSH